jgi:nitronate monooxygenase
LTRLPAAGKLRGGFNQGRAVSLVSRLKARMSLPVIGAPMFIVGVPALVIGQCVNGVIGSFPALNARPAELLDV